MVLCPFVYLLMRYDTEPLALQPSEVHSAHWVSLRAMLSPALNTSVSSDVSGRFGYSDSGLIRGCARLLFGQVLVKAINLVPNASVYSNSIPEFLASGSTAKTYNLNLSSLLPSLRPKWQGPSQQLVLWGLTLGNQLHPSGLND